MGGASSNLKAPCRCSTSVSPSLFAVGSASAWTVPYMEDRIVMAGVDGAMVCAVIDGHGSAVACSFLAVQLLPAVERMLRTRGATAWEPAIAAMFHQLNSDLRTVIDVPVEFLRKSKSGACIAMTIVTRDQIVTANLGDCNAAAGS